MGASDTLLLLGDGIYHLSTENLMQPLLATTVHIYALEEDVKSRRPDLITKVPLINYCQWVEMTIKASPVVSWY